MTAPAAHPPHETNGNGFKLEVGRRALPYVVGLVLGGGGVGTAAAALDGASAPPPAVPTHVERSIEQLQAAREAHANAIALLQQQVGIELKGMNSRLDALGTAVQGLQDEPRFRRREGR